MGVQGNVCSGFTLLRFITGDNLVKNVLDAFCDIIVYGCLVLWIFDVHSAEDCACSLRVHLHDAQVCPEL